MEFLKSIKCCLVKEKNQFKTYPAVYERHVNSIYCCKEISLSFRKNVSDEQENILSQDFTTTSINQNWCTDITYISTAKEGCTYLASVMDLHSKKIIGYSYDTSMTAELAVKAVEKACLNVKLTEGIILHSDL